MADCELINSCMFCVNQPLDMPHTMEYIRSNYCKGIRSTECAIYRYSKVYGSERVPIYLFPNDMFELMYLNLIEPQGGLDIFLRVVYPDGASGKVKSSALEELKVSGKIIAFYYSEGWIDVRRKSKSIYSGVDRRRTNPKEFFAKFN